MRPIGQLKPFPTNARTHSLEQVAQIAASMCEWGFTNPILAKADGTIIAGHGRLLAAQSLGYAELPVMTADGWTDAQVRAYVLADNQLALNAGWDEGLLKIELLALDAVGFDIDLLGFSATEFADLTATGDDGLTDPDDVPETPARAVTQAGDVWLLDGHRLVCGDCTDPAVVGACLGRERPHLMVTDPPYGVEYDPAWRHTAKRSTGERLSIGAHSMGKVTNDDRADWREAWALFPGDVAYVWHSGLHCAVVQQSLEAADFVMRSQIIWNKNVMVISRGHYHFKHEPCWYAVRKSSTGHWAGDRKQTSIWDIPIVHATAGDVDDGKNVHGTQKPVECMRRPIENNSKAGNAVYEPFSGSGTTIIAAEQTGRRCLAIELSPIYVDVAVQRWQNFTGKTATMQATGATYEQTMQDRYDANADGLGCYEDWMAHKREDAVDVKAAKARLKEIKADPSSLVSGPELAERLAQVS